MKKHLRKLIFLKKFNLEIKLFFSLIILVLIILGFLGEKATKAAAGTITCNLTPANLSAGGKVTINATLTFVPTSISATVKNGGNLLATVILTGGGGSYSGQLTTDNSYNGQNDVVVSASDGTQTYICNASDGTLWQKTSVNDIPWQGRYSFGAVSFNGRMWVLGGGGINVLSLNDVWSSTDGLNWVQSANAPWAARGNMAVAVFQNKIWVMGGFVNAAPYALLNDVWSFDGTTWTQATASANWTPRLASGLTVYNNELWLSGGCNGLTALGACNSTVNDVWHSSDGITWVQATAGAPWTARAGHNMLSFDGGGGTKLWIFGGAHFPGPTNYNDVWSSVDGAAWTQETAGAGWAARRNFQIKIFNNGSGDKLWLMGGASATQYNDIWSSPDGVNWTLVIDPPDDPPIVSLPSKWINWTARTGLNAIVFDNKLWVLGGLDYRDENDVWFSSDGTNWTLIGRDPANPKYDAPFGARFDASIVSFDAGSGEKLWLFGGSTKRPSTAIADVWSSSDGINWTCEVGDYTLATNGFTCTNSTAPPWGKRWSHRALVFDPPGPIPNSIWIIAGCSTDVVGSTCPTPLAADRRNDVWYSSDGINWQCAAGDDPSCTGIAPGWANTSWGRMTFGAALFANKMWIMGGLTNTYKNDVWSSSDGTTWVASPNAGWSARLGLRAVNFNDGGGEKIWAMGGYNGGGHLNDVWYTSDGAAWTQATASAGWVARYSFGLLNYSGKMWVFGGRKVIGGFAYVDNEVWSSADGATWTNATSSAEWAARDFLSYTAFDNRIWLAGGDAPGGTANDVWASKFDSLPFNVNMASRPSSNLPLAPTNLSCQAQSQDTIRWNFTDTANNETGFRLYGQQGKIFDTGDQITTDLSYLDETGLQMNILYPNRYVTTFNGAGESGPSNTASCYTLAATPLVLKLGEITKDSLILILDSTDGNPAGTEYAIKELNSNKYVQADGTFGDSEAWQAYDGWGGTNGIKVIGGTAALNVNGNINAQFKISLTSGQPYDFAVKARNGDGVETVFSSATTGTTQTLTLTPTITASKGVGINIGLTAAAANSLIKAAKAGNGIILPISTNERLIALLCELLVFLGIVLILLIIFLAIGLYSAILHLNKNIKLSEKIKLIRHLLSKEPAVVFLNHAKQDEKGIYRISYAKHRAFHLFSQKNFKRVLGLAILDLVILGIVIIGANHNGKAQALYNQNGQTVNAGDQLAYQIEFANQGQGAANNVVITDNLDSNLSYVSGSAKIFKNGQEQTGGITVSGNNLIFATSSLGAGENGYVLLAGLVKDGAEGTTISNQAQVTGDNFTAVMTNTTNNSVPTEVVPPPPIVPPIVPPTPPVTPPTPPITPPVLPPAPPVLPVLPTPSPSGSPAPAAPLPTATGVQSIAIIAGNVFGSIIDLASNPQAKQASQNVVTPILLSVAVINTLPVAIVLTVNVLPYLHLVFSEPLLLFFRKKRKKWGIVYNALTKLPIDLAVVRLYSKKDNKLVQTRVTDREGRYILIVKEPGEYYLSLTKPGFNYPTKYLSKDKQDTKYLDLYHGETIQVSEKNAVITANIPLDPVEKLFIAEKEAIRNYFLKNIRLIVSYVGLILAILVFLIFPTVITGISIIIHFILFLIFMRLIVPPQPKSWGIVYDEKSKQALHYAVVRIFDTKFNKLLEMQVTDGKGRYAFLVGRNEYQLLAEKEGYQKKEIKPVDLINKEEIVDLDIGLQKA